MNIWQQLRKQQENGNNKPFFCVAPMADVTDAAFRRMIAKYSRHGEKDGGPTVMWTEFVSANGLMSKGREVLQRDLSYAEVERPIVAQLFSADPEKMEAAAEFVANLGFDGIDINMGCPDKTIEKQGAGAFMITTPEQALAIIAAVQRGVARSQAVSQGKEIGISVKTRVGYASESIDTWIPLLLTSGIHALSVHARTRKDLSKVPAQWKYLKKVVALRNRFAPEVVIIGNGDVISLADGHKKALYSGVDGVMVGRALFGNPWFFDSTRAIVATLPKKRSPFFIRCIAAFPTITRFFGELLETKRGAPQSAIAPITPIERMQVLLEHTFLFESLLGDIKSFAIMKKHYKAYCTGFVGAKELRLQLMETHSAAEVLPIISTFLKQQAKHEMRTSHH